MLADDSSCVVNDLKGTFVPWPYNYYPVRTLNDAALQSDKSQNVSEQMET